MLENLYNTLSQDGRYTESYDLFKAKFESPDYRRKVYDSVSSTEEYTLDYDSFEDKYYNSENNILPSLPESKSDNTQQQTNQGAPIVAVEDDATKDEGEIASYLADERRESDDTTELEFTQATKKDFDENDPRTWITKDENTIAQKLQASENYPGISVKDVGTNVSINLPNGKNYTLDPDDRNSLDAFKEVNNFYKNNDKDLNLLSSLQFDDADGFNNIWGQAGYKYEENPNLDGKDKLTYNGVDITDKVGFEPGRAGAGLNKLRSYLYENSQEDDITKILSAADVLYNDSVEKSANLKESAINSGEYKQLARNAFYKKDYSNFVSTYLKDAGVSEEAINSIKGSFEDLAKGISKDKREMSIWNYIQEGFAGSAGMTPDEFWGRGAYNDDNEVVGNMLDVNSIIETLPEGEDKEKAKALFNKKIPNPNFDPRQAESEDNPKEINYMDAQIKQAIHKNEINTIDGIVRSETDKSIRQSNRDLIEVGAEVGQRTSIEEKKILDKNVEDFISTGESVLQKEYKKYGDELKVLAAEANEAGVGVKMDENGNFIFNGEDEEAIKVFKKRFEEKKKYVSNKVEDFNTTLNDYKNDYLNWQNKHGETLGLIDQTTRESDIFKMSSVEFENGFRRIGYSFLGLVDAEAAIQKKKSMEEGVEVGLEKKIDYATALATGQKGRFALREASTQGANTLIAMSGTGLVGTAFGTSSALARFTAPALFGTYSASDKYLELSIAKEGAQLAKTQLADLEKNRANMSDFEFLTTKSNLEKVILQGDIDRDKMLRVSLQSGIIEGGVMSIIGTVPNTRAITSRLSMPTLDMSNKIFRSNLKAFGAFGGVTAKQTAGEIIEETSIEALNILNDGVILGKDFDFSTLDDVAVTSIVSAGPTTGAFSAYSTIVEQMQSKEYRNQVKGQLNKLKELELKIADAQGDMKDIYVDEYKSIIDDIAGGSVGLEVDALSVGSENVQKLVKAGMEENFLNQAAGVNPNDNNKVIAAKRESYIKSLDKSEAKKYQDKLNAIQNLREKITGKIDYNNFAENNYGEAGKAMERKLQGNKDYQAANKREKAIMVLNALRKQNTNNNIKKAKADPFVKNQVDQIINDPKNAKLTRQEKTDLENAIYEDFSKNLLVNQRQAYMQASEGKTNAESILTDKQLKQLEIVDAGDQAGLQRAVYDSDSLSQEEKDNINQAIKSGRAKGVIIDNQYIVMDKDAAQKNLDNGDLLQGTVMSHEISHFIDDHAFKTVEEKNDYANKLHSFMGKNSKTVHDLALKRVNGLVDTDGKLLYQKGKSFEEQSEQYKDEYTKSVQDLLIRDDFATEFNDIKNKAGEGWKNKLGRTRLAETRIGRRLGVDQDFSIYTDSNAAFWLTEFIDNFRKGELSPVAKRKLKAAEAAGTNVASEVKGAKKSDIVAKTKQNLQQLVDDASTVDNETGESTFVQDKFNPDSINLINEIPGMVEAQVNNWFTKYPNLVKGFTPDAIIEMKRELGQDVTLRMLESKADRSFDGRGTLYGFLNGRIRFRMLDHFADPNVSVIPDFSQQEINEQRQDLNREFADDLTKEENKSLDEPRVKVNMLSGFPQIKQKENSIIEAVDVQKGDTFKQVQDKNTGKVAAEIFNVPAEKITNPAKNLTYAKKIDENGVPEASEAGNIQSFYNNDNNVKNFIRSLPGTNVTKQDADINELGENIMVDPSVKGRSLGLKKRLIDFFYEPVIEDGKHKRSDGKTSQVPLYKLKPEFAGKVISQEAIDKVKKEAGITPRLQLNNYDRTIGQFLKGLGFYQAQQASLSASQRKLDKQLQDVIDDKTAPIEERKEAVKEIKDQIANITAAQGKYSFSSDVFIGAESALDDYVNLRYGFRIEDLPTIKGERKISNRLLAMYGLDGTYTVKNSSDIDVFIEKVAKPLFKLGPKEMFFGPRGGTVFTSSAKNLGMSSKNEDRTGDNPLWVEFVSKIKALQNDDSVEFGEGIPGVNSGDIWTLTSFYNKLEKPNKTKDLFKNNDIKDFNSKATKIHRTLFDRIAKAIKNDKESARGFATYLNFVSADRNNWHKLGAEIVGYSEKVTDYKDKKGNLKKGRYEIEHAMPATAAYVYLLDAALTDAEQNTNNFPTAYNLVSDNYKVIALDKAMDMKLVNAKTESGLSLQKVMPDNWSVLTNNWFERYFNSTVASQDGGINPASIVGLDGRTFDKIYEVNTSGQTVINNNDVSNVRKMASMSPESETTSRGFSVFDFDETVIDKGENFITAKKGNDTIKISSAQWPIQGPELQAEGYEFDFSDFVNVRGGEAGPLMQKLKNRIKKFGPENTFILTARPAEAATAIHEWLKTQGVDLPIQNITGLANSTGEAKAMWIAGKYSEGYNDVYFVDDALPNVDAVKDVIDQLDMKGSAVQVRFSATDLDQQFNQIIEDVKGVQKEKTFSKAKARQRGKGKGKWKFFLPPAAEDLKGLLYPFMGKGKQGEAHMKFFNDNIIVPYAKAIRSVNALKQASALNLKQLKKTNKSVAKDLKKVIPGTEFTLEQGIIVYGYDQNGLNLEGLSKADKDAILKYINSNKDILAFANKYNDIVTAAGGLADVTDLSWLTETLSSNLNDVTDGSRQAIMEQFKTNWNTIFSDKNLNKIEAEYGLNHRNALEDIYQRMLHGTNRRYGDGYLNSFMNWVHGSIGTTMFFNARSAILQTLSTVNFVNWSDNNPLKAAAAFANQKQFWSDFLMIFNSPFLKQRRSGLSYDVNANELVDAVKGSKKPIKAAIGLLLQKGFLPTQIADSFAIAFGGSTFFRNRVKTYLDQGMSEKEATEKAFIDFQEIAEETQQSARPDKISQLQASALGKVIFAFQNTPMQYNRLMKRAAQDLVNRRGDPRTHISKILYYGAIQNAIFYSLQQALFAVTFGDDEEEKDKEKNDEKLARVANGMADTILRGSGIYGAVLATAKNTLLEFFEQEKKKHRADHAYTVIEAANLGVPIGIKLRKLYSATQSWEFNRDVIKYMPKTHIDNPLYDASFAAIEAITNVPLSRIHGKVRNVREAMNSDHRKLERVAMILGWSTWSFGIQPQALLDAKKEVKELKKEAAKERRKQKKIETDKIKEQENKAVIEKNIEDQKKQKEEGNKKVQCAAVSRSGKRCSNTALPGQNFCTVHQKVEKREDGKQIQCKKIKSDGNRCKMKTTNKSGFCYYHD